MAKRLKIVKITWMDHCSLSYTGWKSIDDVANMTPVLVETVGWLIKETKKYYIVVSTLSDQEHCTGDFLILKGTVKKIKELT